LDAISRSKKFSNYSFSSILKTKNISLQNKKPAKINSFLTGKKKRAPLREWISFWNSPYRD